MKKLFLILSLGLSSIVSAQTTIGKERLTAIIDSASAINTEVELFDNILTSGKESNEFILSHDMMKGKLTVKNGKYVLSYPYGNTYLFATINAINYEGNFVKGLEIDVFQNQFDMFLEFEKREGFTHYSVESDEVDFSDILVKDNIVAYCRKLEKIYYRVTFTDANRE